MKRVSRWLARVCMAAVLLGAMGLDAIPAKAADVSVSPLKVELASGDTVQNFEYQKSQSIGLIITNVGDAELSNIKVSPKVKNQDSKWPFKIQAQNYEKIRKSPLASKDTDKETFVFNFTERDDAIDDDYQLIFSVTAEYEGNAVSYEQPVWVHTTAKPEEKVQEEQKPDNQNPGEEEPGEPMLTAGGFDTGEAAYVGGGGSGSSGNGSVPRVIVTGFTTNPTEVKAGSDFVLIIHLKNTSKKTKVSNMLFELQAPTEGNDVQTTAPAFLPTSGSNSIYMEGIPANGTADISISLNAKADLVQKPYEIALSMKYEDSDAAQIEAGASLSIPVKQNVRFEFSEFEITPESVEVGSEVNVSCNLYNLGRIKLYNVKAIFEGSDIKKEEVFLGNLEPGSSTAIDAMLEGTKASEGEGKVKMTLSYEDEAGAVSTAEESFNLMVMEAMESDEMMMSGMMDEPQAGLPIVPIAVVVVIVIAVAAGIIIKKKRKARKLIEEEEELLDELDGPSEDEQQ